MLDVCLLGTGGMMPLPYRWLTALMLRYNGSSILIDCGEGTQIAMKEAGLSPNPIDVMCFTHYHADHISGLPGMLLSMGNSDRTDPLLMIGPKGLERVVNSLRVIAPELPFEIGFRELTDREEEMRQLSRWVGSLKNPDGEGVPLHITRFFPGFHMNDRAATDVQVVYHLADVARENVKYVYVGNC